MAAYVPLILWLLWLFSAALVLGFAFCTRRGSDA